MYKQGKLYAFAATGFLYAVIVVDLYRKLSGVNVEGLRNIVYVFFFGLLLIDMYRSKHLGPMIAIAAVTMALFGISILINPGYPKVYRNSIFMFISRLWPAYYIGRYTTDWDKLSKTVLLFSPIALAYAVSLFVIPEIADGSAYATIASNLAFVSLISLFACFQYRKLYALPIALICLVPVFFYGTRVFFLGVILSIVLAYIINSNKVSHQKRVMLLATLVIVIGVFMMFSEEIFNRLFQWLPNSRTLKMLSEGEFLDDSNRSFLYDKTLDYLAEHPFDVLGLIGDRIYLSPSFYSPEEILGNFSHNCSLELCMNFGVPIGIVLNVYFLCKLFIAVKKSFRVQNTTNYIYMLILGAGFLNMMVSASYMSSYIVWLLFGLAFCVCDMEKTV